MNHILKSLLTTTFLIPYTFAAGLEAFELVDEPSSPTKLVDAGRARAAAYQLVDIDYSQLSFLDVTLLGQRIEKLGYPDLAILMWENFIYNRQISLSENYERFIKNKIDRLQQSTTAPKFVNDVIHIILEFLEKKDLVGASILSWGWHRIAQPLIIKPAKQSSILRPIMASGTAEEKPIMASGTPEEKLTTFYEIKCELNRLFHINNYEAFRIVFNEHISHRFGAPRFNNIFESWLRDYSEKYKEIYIFYQYVWCVENDNGISNMYLSERKSLVDKKAYFLECSGFEIPVSWKILGNVHGGKGTFYTQEGISEINAKMSNDDMLKAIWDEAQRALNTM